MKSTLKLKPKEVFETFTSYLDFLKSKNFTVKLSDKSELEKNWKELETPLSSDFKEPGSKNYCFHLKNNSLSSTWGMIIRSVKSPGTLASNEFAVDAPEAALDLLLRKMAPTEWVADLNYSNEQAKKYSHVRTESGVVIGPECEIGEGVILEAGVRIGARVSIGKGTRIGVGSRIADDSIIGENCYFRGPVSIGGQGFGFISYPKDPVPKHRLHVGRVLIGDHVQLGSFVSIDRGVLDDTVIGSYCATDNSVQIGHNCKLGKNAILCGFVGLSGSTILGDYVTLGGLVVTKGHIKIGNNVQVGGFSGIYADVQDGARLRGLPAKPIRDDLKIMAIQEKLPEIYDSLKHLIKKSDLKEASKK